MVWEDGDADRAVLAVAGTLMARPGRRHRASSATLHELDGTPRVVGSAHALKRIVDSLQGPRLQSGHRHRARVLPRSTATVRSPAGRTARRSSDGHRPKHYQAYHLQDLDDFAPFFRDLYTAGEIARIAVADAHLRVCAGPDGDRSDASRRRAAGLRRGHHVQAPRAKRRRRPAWLRSPPSWPSPSQPWTGCGMHVHVSLAGGTAGTRSPARIRKATRCCCMRSAA